MKKSKTQLTLGDFLKERRVSEEKSIRAMAKELNISSAYLADIEYNRRFPSENKLEHFSSIFNVSLQTLKEYLDNTLVEVGQISRGFKEWGKEDVENFAILYKRIRKNGLKPKDVLSKLEK